MIELEKFPRVRLAALPTPLEELKNLEKELGGPRLFIKRDDNTGLAFGGNKARKLEFIMGDAVSKGADIVITTGSAQSNHCRMTTAAARRLGMDAALLLSEKSPPPVKANLLLDTLMAAELRFHYADVFTEMNELMAGWAKEFAGKGRKPYVIPVGGSNPTGSLGYINAVSEIARQSEDSGVVFDHIVVAVSSAGTQAGLVAGVKLLDLKTKVVGISVNRDTEFSNRLLKELTDLTLQKVSSGARIKPDELIVYDDYIGKCYADITPECIRAIKLLARTEGIFLDPVYTGKAMAGLIDLVGKGRFKKGENVLFIHTGGSPAIFTDENIFS